MNVQSNKHLAMLQVVCVAISSVMVVAAQSPAGAKADSLRALPAPKNLKVLPKGLTGQQVHDIMEGWSRDLGVRCVACHANVPDGKDTADPPALAFADDSKPMKDIARLMFSMTEQINRNFIAKLEGSGMPVTCGTCHRGNVSPDGFVPTLEQANGSVSAVRTVSQKK